MYYRLICVLLFGFAFLQVTAQPRPMIDSLLQASKVVENVELVTTYIELAIHYKFLPKGMDSTQYYAQKAIDLSRKINYTEGIERGHYYLAFVYLYRDENYTQAIEYFKKILRSLAARKADERMPPIQNAIATAYNMEGNYEYAIRWHEQSIEGALAHEDYGLAAMNLSNLGIIYDQMGQNEKGVAVNVEALDYLEKDQSRDQLAAIITTKLNLTDQYLTLEQYDLAARQIEEMEALADSLQVFRERGRLAVAKMRWLFKQGQEVPLFELAKQTVAEYRGQLQGYDRTILQIALYHYGLGLAKQGSRTEAREVAEELLQLAEGTNDGQRSMVDGFVSEIYEATGDFARALALRKKYEEVQDSLNQEKNRQRVLQLQTIYEVEKTEKELEQKAREKDILQQRLAWLLIALLMVALGVLIFYLRNLKIRQREKEQMNQIEQKMLALQMNPHFIFNAISSIQNFLFDEKDTAAAITHLSTFATLMRQMLENSREKLIPLEDEIQFLENYLQLQKLRFDDQFEYEIHVHPDLDPERLSIPPLITQPFVENAIEHGKIYQVKNGKLKVVVRPKDHQLHIRIIDNGLGPEAVREQESHPIIVKKKSLSIEITRERLQLMSKLMKQKFSLKIIPNTQDQNGTEVSLQVPFAYL